MNKSANIFLNILLTILLFFVCVIISVKVTVHFKSIYYKDIHYLNIEDTSPYLNTNQIKENYNYLIKYITSPKMDSFKLPHLPSSKEGAIHFKEVRNIFTTLNYIFIFSLLFLIIFRLLKIPKGNISFIRWTAYSLIGFPLLLLSFFIINFDKSFTIFHKLFFHNDYWLFDPNLDPIINFLPQEFFFHASLSILSITVLQSLLLLITYKKCCGENNLN